MKKEDLYNLTPEHEAFCKNLLEKYNAYNDGPFTPYSSDPTKNSVIFPGAIGGGNWGGGGYGGYGGGYYGGVCGPIQITLGLCGPYGY
jgi:hypothetical protein